MQLELDIDGYENEIDMYALHPGGPRTTIFGIDPDVQERFPHMGESLCSSWYFWNRYRVLNFSIGPIWDKFHSMFKADPAVPGQVCAFLAAGRGKALRGKYFDCEQNITQVLSQGKDGLHGLYELKVDFMGGLPNDGGAVSYNKFPPLYQTLFLIILIHSIGPRCDRRYVTDKDEIGISNSLN